MTNEELVIKIQAGIDIPENMLQLWEQTRNFIHTVARHYQGLADLEDLEQEGYLALYDAVDRYCPEQEYKFLTYAKYWIQQRMKRYIYNCCQVVRIPVDENEKLYQYRKMENAFQLYCGRKPTEWEIIHNMGLNSRQVKELKEVLRMSQIGSLDSPMPGDMEDNTLSDTVACDTDMEGEVTEKIDRDMLQEVIWPMVDCLPGRQPDVIRKRYQEGMTLREIGEAYGVNLNTIRQFELEGLRRLRRSSGAWKLRAFLPELEEAQAYRHNGAREFNTTWTSSTERIALKLMEKCH